MVARPQDLTIEYVDPPIPIKNQPRLGVKWEVSLAPLRSRPGVRARVLVSDLYYCRFRVRMIRKRLDQVDSHGDWKYEVLSLQNKEDTYGVWVSYHGQLSEKDYQLKMAARAKRSVISLKAAEKRRILKEMQLRTTPKARFRP